MLVFSTVAAFDSQVLTDGRQKVVISAVLFEFAEILTLWNCNVKE